MTDGTVIARAEGSFARVIEVWLGWGVCDGCGASGAVLCVDTSEGEYREGRLCEPCVLRAFAGGLLPSASFRAPWEKGE